MSAHEFADALETSMRDALGSAFRLQDAGVLAAPSRPDCGQLVVQGGGRRFFVKYAPASAADRFAAEVDGLTALRGADAFVVPEVIARGESADTAWLVLEWLDLRPIADAVSAERAAAALARLHAVEGEHFGWTRDNYIGATPQLNRMSDNWARFFALQRIKPQIELALAKGHGGELGSQAERLIDRLPALFLDYRPRPSLVHGDLWHGNIASLPDGRPVLFDPAVHYGDREADLAMSELFGGLPGRFYAAYRQRMPLSSDFEARKLVYNLYHLLNHLNLFGRSYLAAVQRLALRVQRELG